MFRRFFDEGLAQSSYLLACGRTRAAVVGIDLMSVTGGMSSWRALEATAT